MRTFVNAAFMAAVVLSVTSVFFAPEPTQAADTQHKATHIHTIAASGDKKAEATTKNTKVDATAKDAKAEASAEHKKTKAAAKAHTSKKSAEATATNSSKTSTSTLHK